jgi:hypothetical protein
MPDYLAFLDPMDAREIIKQLGGPTKVALRLGCKRSAVSNWPAAGIPSKFWDAVVELGRQDQLDGVTKAAVRWRPATDPSVHRHAA